MFQRIFLNIGPGPSRRGRNLADERVAVFGACCKPDGTCVNHVEGYIRGGNLQIHPPVGGSI